MTVDVSTIYLLDGATGDSVEAELRDAIEQAHLEDWQVKWLPALLDVLQELHRKGVPMSQWPQSAHWNWAQKIAQVEGSSLSAGSASLLRVSLRGWRGLI